MVFLGTDGPLAQWLKKALPLGVEERSACLEQDKEMARIHEAAAKSGVTDVPQDKVNHHFVTFVNIHDTMYEFDSQMTFARPIGSTTRETFLYDIAKVIKPFIAQFESPSFNAMAVVGEMS